MIKANTVEEYFAQLDVRSYESLRELQGIIKSVATEAEETISYGMPCFRENGILVYYAAFKHHFSLFPTGSVIKAFQSRLESFKTSKGTIQFNYGEPMPVELITDIVKFRLEENQLKKSVRKTKKKPA